MFKINKNIALLIGAVLKLSVASVAQQVILQTGNFSLNPPSADTIGYTTLQLEAGEINYFFVARFQKNASFAKNAIGNYELFEKLAPFTYLVKSKTTPLSAWCRQQGIDAIGTLPAKLKLDKRLLQGNLPAYAQSGKGRLKLMVGVWGNINRTLLIKDFASMGWENNGNTQSEADVLTGTLPAENLEKLLRFLMFFLYSPKAPKIGY